VIFLTKEGHDACLGTLPGLMNTCCGHGIIENCCIQYKDGSCMYGKNAHEIIKMLKKGKL